MNILIAKIVFLNFFHIVKVAILATRIQKKEVNYLIKL